MYLSKVMIAWEKARNPYDIHRTLWHLFPNCPDAERDFLYRVEKQERGNICEILMQSTHRPVEPGSYSPIVATREFIPNIQLKHKLRFRLRANPSKKINDGKGRKSSKGEIKKCRVPLIHEEDQRLWLERKFKEICSLDTLIINPETPLYFRKIKEKRTGKIQTTLFDGILCIDDPKGFHSILEKGIGPAKAFGCGLLSIARV